MLPKKNRLNKKQFNEVFKKGRNIHSDFLFAKVLEIPEEENRFAVVTTKKITKKAVTRNLLKRRIYAIIQENTNNLKPHTACAIFLKQGAEELDYKTLKKEVGKILLKSKTT